MSAEPNNKKVRKLNASEHHFERKDTGYCPSSTPHIVAPAVGPSVSCLTPLSLDLGLGSVAPGNSSWEDDLQAECLLGSVLENNSYNSEQ